MKCNSHIIASAIFVIFQSGTAAAALVSYNFGGHFNTIADGFGNFGVTAGDTFFGSFTYDTTMSVASAGTGNVLYERSAPIAPLKFSVTINGITYTADDGSAPLRVQVTDNSGGLHDQFVYLTSHATSLVHPLTGSYPFSTMAFSLRDTSDQVFSSAAIPASLDLSDFDDPQFNMNFHTDPMGDPGDFDNVLFLGTVTFLSAVPEPALTMLMLTALPFLCLAYRWRTLADRRRARLASV